jgi:CO/xanthine dehydrogenase Mo-binding subunit
LGLGLALYVEGTGYRSYEGARVVIEPNGQISLFTGSGSQGQGHETMLAQVVARELGTVPRAIVVTMADSAHFGWGLGTWASRAAVVTANAAAGAARLVREKALSQAAEALETASTDLELRDGAVRVRGAPERFVSLASLASRVGLSRAGLASDGAPGLDSTQFFSPTQATFAAGAHAVLVEVDPWTGHVEIRRYVVAHDCGVMINPRLVEGQIHGGVAQGIGGALLEKLRYGADGQLLTSSLMDYLLPTAVDVPDIEIEHLETRSPTNPLGVKGVGEAGTIPVSAALAAAIEDALSPFGVHITRMPISPTDIVELVKSSQFKEARCP